MTVLIRTPECFPTDSPFDAVPRPPLGHNRCLGGFHQSGVIGGWDCSCPCHHHGGKPTTPQLFECDWGTCDNEAIDSRWSPENGWLPVCAEHVEAHP